MPVPSEYAAARRVPLDAIEALAQQREAIVGVGAHADLLDLPITLYPFDPLADRIWTLRQTVNAYDAWYVALDAPLTTVDHRLARAPGPTCVLMTPAPL